LKIFISLGCHFINFIFYLIPVLVNVALITLIERKILGLSQNRVGPNKTGLFGILQPFSDAVKLLRNKILYLRANHKLGFILAPIIYLVNLFLVWRLMPRVEELFSYSLGILFIFIVLGRNIYGMILIRWCRRNKYSYLGVIRAIAQVVSYEILIILLIVLLWNLRLRFRFNELIELNEFKNIGLFFPGFWFLWLLVSLIESHRAPFDLAERESELVSGFNVEYISSSFAYIFLGEYGFILFFSYVRIVFWVFKINLIGCILGILRVFLILITRRVYVRYRYDQVMIMCWKSLLVPFIFILLVGILLIYFNKSLIST